MRFTRTLKLTRTIKKLRKSNHSNWNEATAKAQAIVPILHILGLQELQMEVKIGEGRVDIVQSVKNRPYARERLIIIECKKPSLNLDKFIGQLIQYNTLTGMLAVLTNGIRWDFYLPPLPEDIEEARKHRFASIDLKSTKNKPSILASELACFLYRRSIDSGAATALPKVWFDLFNDPTHQMINFIKKNMKDTIDKTQHEEENIYNFYDKASGKFPDSWNQIITNPPRQLINLIRKEVKTRTAHKLAYQQVRNFILRQHGSKAPTIVRPKRVRLALAARSKFSASVENKSVRFVIFHDNSE